MVLRCEILRSIFEAEFKGDPSRLDVFFTSLYHECRDSNTNPAWAFLTKVGRDGLTPLHWMLTQPRFYYSEGHDNYRKRAIVLEHLGHFVTHGILTLQNIRDLLLLINRYGRDAYQLALIGNEGQEYLILQTIILKIFSSEELLDEGDIWVRAVRSSNHLALMFLFSVWQRAIQLHPFVAQHLSARLFGAEPSEDKWKTRFLDILETNDIEKLKIYFDLLDLCLDVGAVDVNTYTRTLTTINDPSDSILNILAMKPPAYLELYLKKMLTLCETVLLSSQQVIALQCSFTIPLSPRTEHSSLIEHHFKLIPDETLKQENGAQLPEPEALPERSSNLSRFFREVDARLSMVDTMSQIYEKVKIDDEDLEDIKNIEKNIKKIKESRLQR